MNRKIFMFISSLISIGVIVTTSLLSSGKPVQATISLPSHGTKKPTFHSPTEILGVTIADDTPASMWNYPRDLTSVTLKVYHWLSQAKSVTIQMPKSNVGIINAYIGPSQLSFSDEHGHHIMVYPAYYLADAHQNVYGGSIVKRFPFPGVLVYQDGAKTVYIKSVPLYNWLKTVAWKAGFKMESYTPAEQNAVHTVSASSSWHWLFQNLFPIIPEPAIHNIPRGGLAPLHGQPATLPVTSATYVQPEGANMRVTLVEVWNNGESQHTWTFVVSPKGKIMSHSQSGAVAPQFWI